MTSVGLHNWNENDVTNVLNLVESLMLPDNARRLEAETQFYHALQSNPNAFLFSLIQIALNDQVALAERQASLLHIKRIVPKWWSPAFDSFIGPICFDQNVKAIVRDSLLTLSSDIDSKIRSSAGYATAQIAAVDYPDEWPDLLQRLYNGTLDTNNNNQIVGSLCVLQEIFDDVISEDQFFDGKIGLSVFETCEKLLHEDGVSLEAKIESIRLLRSVATTFAASSINEPSRQELYQIIIPQMTKLLIYLLHMVNSNSTFTTSLICWEILFEVCDVLDILANGFPDTFSKSEFQFLDVLVQILAKQEVIYNELNAQKDNGRSILSSVFVDLKQYNAMQREIRDPIYSLVCCISKEIDLTQSLFEINKSKYPTLIEDNCELLLKLSRLPISKHEEYIEDFNSYVTDETGLGVEKTVRETFSDFFRQLNYRDTTALTPLLVEKLMGSCDLYFLDIESVLFIFQTLLDSDDGIGNTETFQPVNLLELFISFIKDRVNNLKNESQILISRLIILLPRLIIAFEDQLEQYGLQTLQTVVEIIFRVPDDEIYDVLRASVLISFQYFNHFIRAKEFGNDIQAKLITFFQKLNDSPTEDTIIMLLESMSIIICIDNVALSYHPEIFTQILEIGFENCSNFTITTSTLECITDYIKNLPIETYMNLNSSAIPQLLNILNDSSNEYKPEIDFGLQVVDLLVSTPSFELPKDVFNVIFQTVTTLILTWDDDQILQAASQLLTSTIKESITMVSSFSNENGSGPDILLKIVAKFLNPNMSDRAIAKLGDLIALLLENFSQPLQNYLEDIMKGLTIRLTQAREVPTIENLILIFNQLTIAQPQNTLQFLKSFLIDNRPAYISVFPIWFQAFEVMRGYESIFSNVRAFIEIFKLADPELRNMPVDGEPIIDSIADGVIITRSMAKKMPLKVEQVPADSKIIKLLVSELRNEVLASQKQDQNAIDNHSHGHSHSHHDEIEGDDDGWEDFDDVGSDMDFNQLQQYVDDNGELVRASDRSDNTMKECLIQFFKECTTKNLANFEMIYRSFLNDSDRKLLAEYLAFT